ncbi:WG repeat-containing protein [Mucilaginibacter achroorhodeus]|uniref:WG repeat-containing protein n=1 Tax=Mucilaginibacter achroorhodeus TaxID=2599294 RepID=A0A563U2C7_9SPHI|nr:WG repeat-containing protein [Mucilaginibacter achroorhodeus]TWR25059.1 WG repeat-containing protein [Mucilaginibacter achroorhodeus]
MRKLPALILIIFSACESGPKGDLYKVTDPSGNLEGYVNAKHDTVIPLGKYQLCFTDTFKYLAFVIKGSEMLAIDRNEKVLFKPFPFDNGPDYESEGFYRAIDDSKRIGYADTAGNIVIKPQFGCAFPFEKGLAKVSYDCKTIELGEGHSVWESDKWFYINKQGKRVK